MTGRSRTAAVFFVGLPLLAGLLPAEAFATGFTVRLVAGDELEARDATWPGTGQPLHLTLADGAERDVQFDDVVSLAAHAPSDPEAAASNVAVRLVDGSTLWGRLGPGDEDVLSLESPSIGKVELPLEVVAAVAFGPEQERVDLFTLQHDAEDDLVQRHGSGERDALRGTVTSIGSDGIGIESDLGLVEFEPGDVAAVTLAMLPLEGTSEGPTVACELRSGGELRGRLLRLVEGRAVLDTVFADEVDLPVDHTLRIRCESGRFLYLSDLEPAAVEEVPFIGGSDDFLFPWRRDRSVTGEPLTVAGRRFGKGLGVHSRTSLTYELKGSFTSFSASVGVSDEVLAFAVDGALVARFLVDGALRHETRLLKAGEPAEKIPTIDVAGAKTLTVEVDFGDGVDIGDRAVIGDPLLLFAAPR